MKNIRIYKTIHPEGNHYFVYKESDEKGESGAESLETIVRFVVEEVSDIHTVRFSVASIDFKPFHDVECREGLLPRRCVPLDPKEQEDFWSHFLKALEEKRSAKQSR